MTGLRSQRSMKRGFTPTPCLQLVRALFKGGHSTSSRRLFALTGDFEYKFCNSDSPFSFLPSGGSVDEEQSWSKPMSGLEISHACRWV